MAQITWVGSSGSWGTGSNWSGGALPGIYDSVTIDTAGATISIGSQVAAAAYDLSVQLGTLLLGAGGTLVTVDQAAFGSNTSYVQTGGTWNVFGSGAGFNGTVSITGASTVKLYSGYFTLNDGGVLAAKFTGPGALCLLGGQTDLEKGFSTTGLNSLVINARVSFDTSLAMTTTLRSMSNAVIGLSGNTLTLSGNSQLEGVIGEGTLIDKGTMQLGSSSGGVTFHNALLVDVYGQAVQQNNVNLGDGDAGSIVTIEHTAKANGTYTINGNWSISDSSSVGSLVNNGTLQKTFGAGISVIAAAYTNSTSGILAVNLGTIELNGLVNALAGTIKGAGTLAIAGGLTTLASSLALGVSNFEQVGGTLQLSSKLSFAGAWDQNGGILDLGSKSATLTLTGTDNFDGGNITGYGGTIALMGTTQLSNVQIGGPNIINIASGASVVQTGNISLGAGSDPKVTINTGASWSILGDSSISGSYGVIDNYGSFLDPNGVGDANVASNFINESNAILNVDNSTLTLSGFGVALNGTISGSGELDLQGGVVLEAGLVATVGTLAVDSVRCTLASNLSYQNDLVIQGNGILTLSGHTLTASGTALLDGTEITGGGVLLATGTVFDHGTAVGGGSTLLINASSGKAVAEQTGNINLAPNDGGGTLMVGANAIYTIDDAYGIAGNGNNGNGVGNFVVDGTLSLAGTGNSVISSGITLAGHTVLNTATLSLNGTGTVGGSIVGGELAIAGGTYTLAAGTLAGGIGLALNCGTLALGGALLSIGDAANSNHQINYGGLFEQFAGTLSLGNDTLTLAGTSVLQNGAISGSGTLLASGAATLVTTTLTAGAVLDITGSATQLANTALAVGAAAGDTGVLQVASGGTLTLHGGDTVQGPGTLSVAGSVLNVGNGTDNFSTAIVDTGQISVSLGTLNIANAVSGTGSFVIASAGTLAFSSAATITASNQVSFSTAGGELWLDTSTLSAFGASIADFITSDRILLNGLNLNSLTQTLSANHLQLLVSDGSSSITLTFASALNGTLTASAGMNGVLLTHS